MEQVQHNQVTVSILEPWQDPRGGQIERILLDNGILALEVLSLGGIIRGLWAPDRQGNRQNVVLGTDSAAAYLAQKAHLGGVAGRYSNRIANSRINWRDRSYQLDNNFHGHCLHGGHEGFNRKHWQMDTLPDGVRLTLNSPDGDMGFPGHCRVQLDYRLAANNLYVEFTADCDVPCPVSLTQHSYFNLDGSDDIRQQHIQLHADKVLVPDEHGIPQRIMAVEGSVFDLRRGVMMGTHLDSQPLAATRGYDHCYLMEIDDGPDTLLPVATVSSPLSGRAMRLYSNQPGVQFYTANFLQGTPGRQGQVLHNYQGWCLEPQMLPDAPNQPHLPGNPWLLPGQQYHHLSRYRFTNDAPADM
ncbi:aldose epimerase family protein [Shewanella sp. YIC-542]|uniref:aldose epimerase family protein n=1 Tax=Shewanella mytili TaxID=3377111 RepID=UPI00398E5B32